MLCNSCGAVLESFQKFCSKCGAPAPAPYQPPTFSAGSSPYSSPQTPMGGQMGPPPRKSSCGKILLILGVILLLLVMGVAAAIYFGYHKLQDTLKSSEAYTTAVRALKESPEVNDKLGDIVDTGFPLGAFTQNADGTGNAAFTMSVQGTKSTGQYGVELVRHKSVWKVRSGNVKLANGEVIEVGDGTVIDVEDVPDVNSTSNTNTPVNSADGKTINGGVLNGKAISLPQPAYPPIARQAHASGTVVVQVVVDEKGNVISATGVSGHPLLRAPAIVAARAAKFAPTKLSGKPVKVSGVLTYNFAAE